MDEAFKQSAKLVHQGPSIFRDDVTKNKISRHLMDINDTITEEDIRNINIHMPAEYSVELSSFRKSR